VKRLALGLSLTAVAAALLGATSRWQVAVAGTGFGLLATGIHLAAIRLLRPALGGSVKQLAARESLGLALRLAGAGVWLAAALADPETFPALPTAGAYLGVLMPLLFMEIRFLR
jgi:hypothetical protein